MQAYKVVTTVDPDGSVTLDCLPFPAGERVEVIVLATHRVDSGKAYPLRGTPYRYDEPTEPVAEADWEAAQ